MRAIRNGFTRCWLSVRCLAFLFFLIPCFFARPAFADTDLSVQSAWTNVSYVVGKNLSFTLTVTNAGPDVATAVTVTNFVPATFSFVSALPSQGSSSNSGSAVFCDLGDLAPQQFATVVVSVTPILPGSFTNKAVAATTANDTNATNNIATKTGSARVPFVSMMSTNVLEGDSGFTNMPFVIWLENATPQTVSVDFQTQAQSATAGVDFLSTNGTLIFPPGVVTQVVNVTVVGDRLYELADVKTGGEVLSLSLVRATNAAIEQLRFGSGTIVNDDPMPALSIADATVIEGEAGTTQAVFNITLSAPSGMATTLRWVTSNGSALAGQDYGAASIPITINAGVTSAIASVTVYGDTQFECTEALFVSLTNAVNATIVRTQAVGTIIADELKITLPATAVENAGTLSNAGEVSIGCAGESNLVVTLSNSTPSLISIPTSVTILAGQTNATFDVQVLDNASLNGSRIAGVTASAPSHANASASLIVHDNEATTLSIVVPAVIAEGAGTCTGLVQSASAPAVDVLVMLSNDDTNRVQTPATVILPAGQTAGLFLFQVPNDFLLNGSKTVTLTAHVEGWSDGVAPILIKDLTNLSVAMPATLVEGQWATGIVQTTAATVSNLSVSILAGGSNVLACPVAVQIPAGQLSNTFAFQAVDDAIYRGTQTVAVAFTCDALRGATNTVSVFENDADHFTISHVPVSREAYVYYYDLVLTACDPAGAPVPFFTRSISMTATGLGGAVNINPGGTDSFKSGVCTQYYYFHGWDTNVQITVSDGQGHTGTSNPFNIVRPFYHTFDLIAGDLAWDSIRSRIYASVGDGVTTINPWNGKMESTFYVGPGTGRMAISDDSQYLYVALTGTNLIRRINLATMTIDQEIALGDYVLFTYHSPRYVDDMQVQPGNHDVLVVSRYRPGVSPRAAGVVAFDNGVQRPSVYADVPSFGPNYIEFGGSPTRLYGYDTQVSSFTFHRMDVTAAGVVGSSSGSYMSDYGLDFTYGNGRIYVNNGQVFNPEAGYVGSLGYGGVPVPAPDIGKVLLVTQNALIIYQESNLGFLNQKPFSGAEGSIASGIRWGKAGVAFRSYGKIYVLSSDYLADLNQDGIPDQWQTDRFGSPANPNALPGGDPDHDGRSNYEEWVAGTDPMNAADVLRLGKPQVSGSNLVFRFPSVVGRGYRLMKSNGSLAGPWTMVDEAAGTGGEVLLSDAATVGQSARFYRLLVIF